MVAGDEYKTVVWTLLFGIRHRFTSFKLTNKLSYWPHQAGEPLAETITLEFPILNIGACIFLPSWCLSVLIVFLQDRYPIKTLKILSSPVLIMLCTHPSLCNFRIWTISIAFFSFFFFYAIANKIRYHQSASECAE